MEYRNARFSENGTIECEIDHPDFGWIPFTASPDDPELHGREFFALIRDSATPYSPLTE